LLRQYAVRDLLVVQSLLRGEPHIPQLETDYPFQQTSIFQARGFPLMYFIEKKYSGDETNWWFPNNACLQAMLRSAGFRILDHPEDEVYLCSPCARPTFAAPTLPAMDAQGQPLPSDNSPLEATA
jgi:tRNA (mo5U34)-methyltransferase